MLKRILVPLLLPLLLLSNSRFKEFGNRLALPAERSKQKSADNQTGTLEKMIVAKGSVSMDIALNRLNGLDSRSKSRTLRFAVAPNSFFPVLVLNDLLRGPLRGSMQLIPQDAAVLPPQLEESFNQLVIE